jgi:hypothetical protein
LKALGCSTLDHEETLRIFESTLEILLEHEQTLRERETRKNLAPKNGCTLALFACSDAFDLI